MTIEELRELCNKATPGEWEFIGLPKEEPNGEFFKLITNNPVKDEYGRDVDVIAALGQSSDSFWLQNPGDIEFITKARTYLPLLLRALERSVKNTHAWVSGQIDNYQKAKRFGIERSEPVFNEEMVLKDMNGILDSVRKRNDICPLEKKMMKSQDGVQVTSEQWVQKSLLPWVFVLGVFVGFVIVLAMCMLANAGII